MSAIYQDQEFTITEQDLAQVEQELNPLDDYQSPIISESSFNAPINKYEDEQYSDVENYLLSLETRWDDVKPLSPEEEQEWLEYENERLESDLLESEENYL